MQFSKTYFTVIVPDNFAKDVTPYKERCRARNARAKLMRDAGVARKYVSHDDALAHLMALGLNPAEWEICEAMDFGI